MATYESIHTGQAVDQATDKVLANKSKGTSSTPIYLDANGAAQPISKDATPVEDSAKLVESGGVYTELSNKYNKADISTDDSLGTSTVLIPSEGAVKTYTDNAFAGKQNALVAGDGINVDGNVVSLGDTSGFMSADELSGKRQHFSEELPVGYQSDVLAKMNEAKHSSFDRNKFTVVGSPKITDDGIASGFSSSNWLRCFVPRLINATNFEIDIEFTPTANTPDFPFILNDNAGATYGISVQRFGNGIRVRCNDVLNYVLFPNSVVNNSYRVNLKSNGTITLYTNGNYTDSKNLDVSTMLPWSGAIELGNRNGSPSNSYFTGSIDLKQFSITVDGVEVFSGNKTGIDTIKPDNYTVVGTPTISDDGIASGFNTSNYLYKDFSTTFVTKQNWGFELECTYNGTPDGTIDLLRVMTQTDDFGWVILRQVVSGGFAFSIYNGTTNVALDYTPTNVNTGDRLRFVCKQESYSLRTMDVYVNGVKSGNTLTSTITLDTSQSPFDTKNKLCIGGNYARTYGFKGSIDLNSIKIYVDGNLIYQPCLKIPYTLAKDGKKIVDSYYKSRVEDMYGQAKYTPYYSLQTENKGNYAVVGSPTISSDFVASGFTGGSGTAGNYLITPTTIPADKDFEINIEFPVTQELLTKHNTPSNQELIGGVGDGVHLDVPIIFRLWSSGSLSWLIRTDSTKYLSTNAVSLQVGDVITANLQRNKTQGKYIANFYKNGVLIESQKEEPTNNDLEYSTSLIIGRRKNDYAGTTWWAGSIDLNAFKIYVDGNLTYQAVIPPNYTMQTVKPSDLIDSKISGANIYRQYANQTIEQYGTCTGTTAVTFEKPFMDTNYSLSVPYSAKTKAGFTPNLGSGVTRSWKAKGKVSI